MSTHKSGSVTKQVQMDVVQCSIFKVLWRTIPEIFFRKEIQEALKVLLKQVTEPINDIVPFLIFY